MNIMNVMYGMYGTTGQSAISIRIEISNNQHRVQEFRVQSQNLLSLGKLYYILLTHKLTYIIVELVLELSVVGSQGKTQFNNNADDLRRAPV